MPDQASQQPHRPAVASATSGGGLPWDSPGDAPSAPVAWAPSDLSPEGWFRADLGVTDASLEVTDWVNQGSEAGLTTTQGTAARRPDLVASDANFNGQAVINFDGGDVMASSATAAWELAADGDDMTVLAVLRPVGTGLKTLVAAADSGTGRFQLRPRASSASRFIVTDGTTSLENINGTITINTVAVLAGVYTGAVSTSNDSLSSWLDGSTGAATTGDQGRVFDSGGSPFLIGAKDTGGGTGFNGQVAEILFLKRVLTSGEDASLTAYLNTRYGLSLTGVTQ